MKEDGSELLTEPLNKPQTIKQTISLFCDVQKFRIRTERNTHFNAVLETGNPHGKPSVLTEIKRLCGRDNTQREESKKMLNAANSIILGQGWRNSNIGRGAYTNTWNYVVTVHKAITFIYCRTSGFMICNHLTLMSKMRNTYKVLVGKPKSKTQLGRLRRRWEDNIKTDLK
jgi:hypothetical protein